MVMASSLFQYLDDTPEVKEAKEAFFKIFNKALDGLIETAYLEDTKVSCIFKIIE
jgi:hypothetical protein